MTATIEKFASTFSWYRNLTIALLKEIPDEVLQGGGLSDRSVPIVHQFIDVGDMQLAILKKMSGKDIVSARYPVSKTPTKDDIIAYLNDCSDIMVRELKLLPQTARLDWFGRMDFDFEESLAFLLAHEAMHHGEILSFIFSKNLPMPQAFKDTWGFER